MTGHARVRRDERGVGEILVAVLVTAGLVGLALVPAIIQDIGDLASGRWNRRDEPGGRSGAAAVTLPFVGPALPDDEQQAACIQRIAAGSGLQWMGSGKGWRAPGAYPEPQLTGDPATDRGTVAVWTEGVTGLVAATASEWQSCLEPPPTTTTLPLDTAPVIPGTYQFTYDDAVPECARDPERVTVTEGGGRVTLRGSFGTITAALGADYTFDGETSAGGDASVTYRLRGRFARFGETTLIREGRFDLNVGGGCSVAYSAERVSG